MLASSTPSGSDHYSVAVYYLRLLTDYAQRNDLPLDGLLEYAGIDAAALAEPNDRVPFSAFSRLCDITAEALGDPCLGIKLGQSIRPGHLGSHGVALMSCSTGEELIRQSARYSVLTIDAGHNVIERHGDECIRYWRSSLPNGAPLGRLQDELHQVTWIALARWFANRDDVVPNWVSFKHARPRDTSGYEAFFRCPLHFDAKETAIGFDARYLDLPLPHADAKLRRVMDDLCAQLLKQLGDALEPSWLAIARKAVLESFRQGVPELQAIAQATGLSEAQFKEHLAARGLSFRSFIDDLRNALALGYTRDPSLGLADIAYLLGFSEQSAFQRAFKRWTGMTPGQYRRIQTAAAHE